MSRGSSRKQTPSSAGGDECPAAAEAVRRCWFHQVAAGLSPGSAGNEGREKPSVRLFAPMWEITGGGAGRDRKLALQQGICEKDSQTRAWCSSRISTAALPTGDNPGRDGAGEAVPLPSSSPVSVPGWDEDGAAQSRP